MANDAAELELPVWTPATSEAFATYGTLDEGAIAQKVQMPGGVVKEFGALEITTSSTGLQGLTDAVLYLIRYPFDCNEQISSRMMSIAALRDVLGAFGSKELPKPAVLAESMKADMEKLRTRQHYSGGFSLRALTSSPTRGSACTSPTRSNVRSRRATPCRAMSSPARARSFRTSSAGSPRTTTRIRGRHRRLRALRTAPLGHRRRGARQGAHPRGRRRREASARPSRLAPPDARRRRDLDQRGRGDAPAPQEPRDRDGWRGALRDELWRRLALCSTPTGAPTACSWSRSSVISRKTI